RLALQTREQHIRRDRATSNICTAQVLLAVIASMYAVYHGPEGLTAIARRVHQRAREVAAGLAEAGIATLSEAFFDTVTARVPGRAAEVVARAAADPAEVHLRLVDADTVGVSCGETTTEAHVVAVLRAFGAGAGDDGPVVDGGADPLTPLGRWTAFLTHPVFHRHRSETAMLRYLRRLSDRDYALDRGMIPLGSCTMKLNATAEMEPISFPGFAGVHPFAPPATATGYARLIGELETWLAELTGYARVSLQPNAGSQGELTGLLAIRAYHRANGDPDRDVCLIPASAHGTNAASAVAAGLRVVVIASRDDGTIDLDDLRAKCAEHDPRLAAIMVTYPSTHGVYEAGIGELCRIVHDHGGQVYVDGANLNALVGLAEPGHFGGDVSHLNLHKTFCIPHGGGGPGVGPVAVAEHLAPYLPTHPLHPDPSRRAGPVGPVAAAPHGSAGILPISWAYLRLMGPEGLALATKAAVLAANYLATRLGAYFPVLYAGNNGLVAHECILDLRPLTKETGVTVEDVAKRLIDYGFHAPTMSFPVAGTLMVEPTESEGLEELDRFCDAMIAIRAEIDAVAAGRWSAEDSPLRHAPHVAADLVGPWERGYDRATGVYPAGITADKYWPPVGRIDQARGDRHLVCSCPPPDAFAG
ncbi:MAG TPA: aminomethyl-transferring glycine dehydrogenase, partial [Acidimicrobiales bacterium]|nr:aminomethyl-transferring glycine dehydrogenase [Acidimicrobiales bacterium]